MAPCFWHQFTVNFVWSYFWGQLESNTQGPPWLIMKAVGQDTSFKKGQATIYWNLDRFHLYNVRHFKCIHMYILKAEDLQCSTKNSEVQVLKQLARDFPCLHPNLQSFLFIISRCLWRWTPKPWFRRALKYMLECPILASVGAGGAGHFTGLGSELMMGVHKE